jgi:hypothetical protein
LCIAGFLVKLLSPSKGKPNLALRGERIFWASVLVAIYGALCLPQFRPIVSLRSDGVERSIARRLQATDIVFSDHRTAASLVFFRTHSLASSTATTMPFENLSVSDVPTGAYVLIDRSMVEFLTSSYKYQRPAFVDAPPPAWRKVWTDGNAVMFQVGVPARERDSP